MMGFTTAFLLMFDSKSLGIRFSEQKPAVVQPSKTIGEPASKTALDLANTGQHGILTIFKSSEIWLLVWNMFFSIYWEFHHPN
jgi:hypothetical protein